MSKSNKNAVVIPLALAGAVILPRAISTVSWLIVLNENIKRNKCA